MLTLLSSIFYERILGKFREIEEYVGDFTKMNLIGQILQQKLFQDHSIFELLVTIFKKNRFPIAESSLTCYCIISVVAVSSSFDQHIGNRQIIRTRKS